jgi:hypothetical protein
MTFFNSKEEVIDIELTQHGKHLLSKGKWKPVYYEFYDDDIVYDYEYAGTSENQSGINSRIKEQPRTKAQYNFSDAEQRVREYLKQIRERGLDLEILEGSNEELATRDLKTQDSLAEIKKSLYTNFLPLGNSSKIQNLYPQLKTRFILGEISSSATSLNLTGLPNNLYSLTLEDLEYTLYQQKTEESLEQIISEEDLPSRLVFKDQTFINVETEEIFLEIAELNTDNLKENFEISFFAIEEIEVQDPENPGQTKIKEIEVSLNFVDEQKETKVVNNIMVENPDIQEYNRLLYADQFNNPEFVKYFLDVNTDKEIPENILCNNLSRQEISRLKIVDGYDIICGDEETEFAFSTDSTNLRLNQALRLQNDEE